MIKFPAAVWFQPLSSFAGWAALGVNSLVGYDSGPNKADTLDAWCKAATAVGLSYWLQTTVTGGSPALNLNAHANDPNLLGWLILPDEPNGAGAKTAGYMLDQYVAAKALANRPVMISLDGGHVLQFGQGGTAPYLAACDVVSVDGYPINYNGAGGVTMATLPTIVSNVKAWSGGKPVYVCQECSDMNIKVQGWCAGTPLAAGMRGPLPSEMAKQAAGNVKAGASGITWFPQRIGQSFESYDGTTLDQRGAMAALNTYLNQ